MKKLFSILLTIAMLLSFAACGSSEPASKDSASAPADGSVAAASSLTLPDFETTSFGGDSFTREDIKDAKVIILNLWEPWCKPCVGEMPELEKLYEDYKDKGLVVLGVYTTTDMEEDVEAIIADTGVTYPIIHAWEDFEDFDAAYRPTTWIFDSEGNSLIEGATSGIPKMGAYLFWSALVEEVL